MAHFQRTQSDAVWGVGYTVPRTDFEDLDRKQFQAINGDRGGCWGPSAPIEIDGAGVQVTGPTEVTRGGTVSAPCTLTDPSWPRFGPVHPLRQRRLVCSPLDRLATPRFFWMTRHTWPVGVQSLALGTKQAETVTTPSCIVPLRVHDGATLAAVTFKFRVPSPRNAAPEAMPKFRVFRVDLDGNATDLKATILNDGFDGPAQVASAAEWYASGAAQSFVYTCDQHNVIDRASYSYLAQIVEEASSEESLSVERKEDARCATTGNVSLTGAANVDGVTVATGDRVLVLAQTNTAQNGIWIANTSGPWTRAFDLNHQEHFSPGFIVGVTEGIQNRNRFFRCASPSRSARFPIGVGTTAVIFRSLGESNPVGNIYTSILLDFTNIQDMRWQ